MKTVPILRRVSRIEGYSWLVLLCIAMPLKYWFDQPLAVRIGSHPAILRIGRNPRQRALDTLCLT